MTLHQMVKRLHSSEPRQCGKYFVLSLWSLSRTLAASHMIPDENETSPMGWLRSTFVDETLQSYAFIFSCVGGSQPWLHLRIPWRSFKKFLCPSPIPDKLNQDLWYWDSNISTFLKAAQVILRRVETHYPRWTAIHSFKNYLLSTNYVPGTAPCLHGASSLKIGR